MICDWQGRSFSAEYLAVKRDGPASSFQTAGKSKLGRAKQACLFIVCQIRSDQFSLYLREIELTQWRSLVGVGKPCR